MPFAHIPLPTLTNLLPLVSASTISPALYRASICPGPIIFSFIFLQYPHLPPGCTLNGCLQSMPPLCALLTIILTTSCISQSALFHAICSHPPYAISCVLHSNHLSLSYLILAAPDLPKTHALHFLPTSTPVTA